jgi:type II secretory pathway component GspD/PulD (secretin)
MTQREPVSYFTREDDEQTPPPATYQVPGAVKPLEPGKDQPKVEDFDGRLMPRLTPNADVIQGTNKMILLAQNREDMIALINIIKAIEAGLKGSEAEIQVFLLKHEDATTVTGILNQLFSKLSVSTNVITFPGNRPVVQGPGGFQQGGAAQNQPVNLVLIPLPRNNGILVAAPKAQIAMIQKEIDRLDVPNRQQTVAVPFRLNRAPAQRVAIILSNFYNDRYPADGHGSNQVRFTYDEGTNTLFVQAPPNDMLEIQGLIDRMDNFAPGPMHELKVIKLKSALSDDLAALIRSAVSEGLLSPVTNTAGTGGATGAAGAPAGGTPTGVPGAGGIPGRQNTAKRLEFRGSQRKDGQPSIADFLDDIRITSYTTANVLVISAPPKTMELIMELINELDRPPQAIANLTVFSLKNGDAAAMALMLQQLYQGATPGSALPRPAGTATGTGAVTAPAAPTAAGGATQPQRSVIAINSVSPEGYPLIDIRITIDERSNSLIVAGSRNDIDVIGSVIDRLDNAPVQVREYRPYRLNNALAGDVATALQTFYVNEIQQQANGNIVTAYQELIKNVVITPEPITNTLILGGSPAGLQELMKLISAIDQMPPQVTVDALVAEVDVNDDLEFGVELGLQTPLMFYRSLLPNIGNYGGNSVTYTATAATGVATVPSATSVTTTGSNTVPLAVPGYNFTNPQLGLGINPLVSPANVGVSGITNLGVGRTSSSQSIGGFVYSMQSDFLSVLIRALKTQGRINVLSRPQLTCLDNQTALLNVGQKVPYNGGSNATATGTISVNVAYANIGVNLQLTPKIMPDGKVLMRVIPEVSSVVPTLSPLGNGQSATAFNLQHFESTVVCMDGETIVMGGMIQKQTSEQENKVPWAGDLPGVGWLFRYRTRNMARTELLVILTPHVIRCSADSQRVLAEEAKKIQWKLNDVVQLTGTSGMGPVLQSQGQGGDCYDYTQPSTPYMRDMPYMREMQTSPQVLPQVPQQMPPAVDPKRMPPATQLPPVTPPQGYFPSPTSDNSSPAGRSSIRYDEQPRISNVPPRGYVDQLPVIYDQPSSSARQTTTSNYTSSTNFGPPAGSRYDSMSPATSSTTYQRSGYDAISPGPQSRSNYGQSINYDAISPGMQSTTYQRSSYDSNNFGSQPLNGGDAMVTFDGPQNMPGPFQAGGNSVPMADVPAVPSPPVPIRNNSQWGPQN